jgi:peptidoglycan/LPS O-acetylase OafA/YrhL
MVASIASGGRYYRPELDVVRFFAFFLVFLFHTVPTGDDPRLAHHSKVFLFILDIFQNAFSFGVCLFFALSAFLICELLLREKEIIGTVSVKQFYFRRILRIWPLYYFALAHGVIICVIYGHQVEITRFIWYAIFLGAWDTTLRGVFLNPISPLWSISIEEQFYLFAPWAVQLISRKSLYGFCAAIILGANIRLYFLCKASASLLVVWTNALVQFECFAAGIVLCLVLRSRLPRIALWKRLLLFVGGWSFWLYASYIQQVSDTFSNWPLTCARYTLIALGSVLLIVAVLGVNRKRLPAWAIYLGRISFGLYVYHMFAIELSRIIFGHYAAFTGPAYYLKAILALGLTLLMAALSYRFLETPFLKMKKRHAVIESQPIRGD